MTDDNERPVLLSGLWAVLAGGLLLTLLSMWVVEPPSGPCGSSGSGSHSSFRDPSWDVIVPLLVLGWLLLVVMEQVLSITWRGRGKLAGAIRAGAAVLLCLTGSCFFLSPLVACT
ncbi:hypothetical protein [Actinoplanes sp. NPDC051494]|uniref:hypothetical protein n=1 Tax=Actinoplanes sp. NPDC051494 TaxID=3363907 RepID=UPI0037A7225D